MAIIKELKGDRPVIGQRAFLAETATIIGTVEMGDDCSVWQSQLDKMKQLTSL